MEYGYCDKCGHTLIPIYYTDKERNYNGKETGREILAVSYLLCEGCGSKVIVDNSFDKVYGNYNS